jgi:uncharacterized membrane protein YdfJ with MMPL/SSD domain
MTERLAGGASRRPWLTLGVWVAVIVVSTGLVATLLGGVLSSEVDVTTETESKRAERLLAQGFPPTPEGLDEMTTEVAIVRFASMSADDAAAGERIKELAAELHDAGATNVVTAYDTRNLDSGDEAYISRDGDATALLVGLGPDAEEKTPDVVDAVQRLDEERDVEAAITGEWTTEVDFGTLSEDDLREGELFFGAPAALVVLMLVFGAVVAGLLPLLLAIMSIVVALALTALVGQAFELSLFVTNMIFGMGLALGIDYSLFILSRYREERADGLEKAAAIAAAGATASRAVLFSGMAFVLAMFGLLLVPNTIMRSLAAGAILVGIVSVLAALTLLPALLGLLGDRVNALRIPYFGRTAGRQGATESRWWGAVVRRVMRRPVISLALGTAILLAAASPVLALETGSAGIATLPDRLPSKQGFVLLNEEFPGQTVDPVQIVVDGDADSRPVREGIDRLEGALARHELFGEPEEESSTRAEVTLLTVPVAGDALSKEAVAAVRDLRSDVIPRAFAGTGTEALVTGETAEEIDYYDVMNHWLPIVLLVVLGLSFILLTVAFRSVVVAAKAIVLNLLSVGAAYGLLVLVFQKGYGNEIFGFQQVDTIEAWVPLFLFAVLFGLSMDYQVFLLSRIRERFVHTGDNDRAVESGVGTTARLITGAALIIIAVFSGFARGDLVMFQQMGFGVAVALLIDATLIRSVLVPAAMKLLGRRNWYLPSWLGWIPDVHVEGAEDGRRRPASAAR